MAKKKNDIEQMNLFDEMDTASLPRSTTAKERMAREFLDYPDQYKVNLDN